MSKLVEDIAESPVAICMIENGRIAYASEATAEVSGFPPERFHGRRVAELVHPDDQVVLSPLAAEGWTGEFDFALRLQDSDGRWTWRRVWGIRKIDEMGQPFAVVTLRKIDS